MFLGVVEANIRKANFPLAEDAHSPLIGSEDYADAQSQLRQKLLHGEVNDDLVMNDNADLRAHLPKLLRQRSGSIGSRIYRDLPGSAAKPGKLPGFGHSKCAE